MDARELFERGQRVIPGGVNSPVRAFGAVGGTPIYVEGAKGTILCTAEGRELIDFCGSWGPLILGHAHSEVVDAVQEAVANGTSFGINTRVEVEFAELICRQIPYVDKVRLVSSGTEAVMTALRLARGHTERNKILKFEGGYHGHSDALLVAAGSGLLTAGIASSAGVPPGTVGDTFLAPYNDLEAVQAIADEHGDALAAVILEPVAGNMGLVPADEAFLRGLRDITTRCGALLIFDEVISGFRLAPSTYGNLCGVTPDLTCLGKIIGGGMPIGAVAGPAAIMDGLAPLGKVYQAGTLSGNPVAVAAGRATLETLIRDNPYPTLAQRGERLARGLNTLAAKHGAAMHCARMGGMFTPFFRSGTVRNLADAKACDTAAHAAFFHHMLDSGFYLPPSQFEVAFISAAHTETQIDMFLEAVEAFLLAA